MPSTVWIPRTNAIQRGDRWSQQVLLHDDFTDKSFSLTFAHSRYDTNKIEATIDDGHLGDTDPYLWLILEPEDTAAIVPNLIEGELQADEYDTWFKIVVPVTGQINVSSS